MFASFLKDATITRPYYILFYGKNATFNDGAVVRREARML
jgi:hypothetical protein